MRYEDQANYEAERVKGLRERGAGHNMQPGRRQALMKQLMEVVDAIEGQISAELLTVLREELCRLEETSP